MQKIQDGKNQSTTTNTKNRYVDDKYREEIKKEIDKDCKYLKSETAKSYLEIEMLKKANGSKIDTASTLPFANAAGISAGL